MASRYRKQNVLDTLLKRNECTFYHGRRTLQVGRRIDEWEDLNVFPFMDCTFGLSLRTLHLDYIPKICYCFFFFF